MPETLYSLSLEKSYSGLRLYHLYCGAGRRGVLHTPFKIKFVRKGRICRPYGVLRQCLQLTFVGCIRTFRSWGTNTDGHC